MKTTRAKFTLTVKKNEDGSTDVRGEAVATGSEENKAFSDLTPIGRLLVNIAKGAPAEANFTEEGTKEYFIDITECPPPPPVVTDDAATAEKAE